MLAIKAKQEQNEKADQERNSMLQMICQIKEMKEEMAAMNSDLNGGIVGMEDEVGKLSEESAKLNAENTENCSGMEEMKKEIDVMKKEMNKLKEGIDKILRTLGTIHIENLHEKFEMKEELVEKECATKEMDKNKKEIEVSQIYLFEIKYNILIICLFFY